MNLSNYHTVSNLPFLLKITLRSTNLCAIFGQPVVLVTKYRNYNGILSALDNTSLSFHILISLQPLILLIIASFFLVCKSVLVFLILPSYGLSHVFLTTSKEFQSMESCPFLSSCTEFFWALFKVPSYSFSIHIVFVIVNSHSLSYHDFSDDSQLFATGPACGHLVLSIQSGISQLVLSSQSQWCISI